ncbi:MAG: hypothetical protein KDF58_11835 [Alphaproteobacteria bacterium]|nr:hypothetical protein [Alphaproteobacteria bacterium]HPF46600.1 hypothetical protein [Emcibacteraceae bacterium]
MRDKKQIFDNDSSKLSARMSVFAWIICAMLGWALAFTSFATLKGDDDSGNSTITAKNEPSADDAANMENILPAAGKNQSDQ